MMAGRDGWWRGSGETYLRQCDTGGSGNAPSVSLVVWGSSWIGVARENGVGARSRVLTEIVDDN